MSVDPRPVPPRLVPQTIGSVPVVVGTTDPRLYDQTVGACQRS